MKYTLEILIHKSRAEVWKAFVDPEKTKLWQPSLIDSEPIRGQPGHQGAVTKLIYKENERDFSLVEEVIYCNEPNRFGSQLENKFAINTVNNIFSARGNGQTLWTAETKYRFKTFLMKIMGQILKKNYVARSQRDMERFKEMMERE